MFEALRHLFSTSGMVQINRLCPTVPRHFLVEIFDENVSSYSAPASIALECHDSWIMSSAKAV